jgi:transcriptional regulator with XRE-family HTH domain
MDTKLDQFSTVVQSVSRNLRQLRVLRGLTLNDLATLSGVAKATITGLEAGRGNPTVETMCALSTALGVSYGALLAEPDPQMIRVVRSTEGGVIEGAADGVLPGHTEGVRLLDRITRRGVVEVYELTFPVGSRRDAEPHNEGVVEYLLVTEGRLVAGPVGDEVELTVGDFVRFPGDRLHRYEAVGGTARATLVMDYPPQVSADVPLSVPLMWATRVGGFGGIVTSDDALGLAEDDEP